MRNLGISFHLGHSIPVIIQGKKNYIVIKRAANFKEHQTNIILRACHVHKHKKKVSSNIKRCKIFHQTSILKMVYMGWLPSLWSWKPWIMHAEIHGLPAWDAFAPPLSSPLCCFKLRKSFQFSAKTVHVNIALMINRIKYLENSE